MANMTDAFENEALDLAVGVTGATKYIGLFTANPTDTGSVLNEVVGTGYVRASLDLKFGSASGGSTANTAKVSFAVSGSAWGIATYVGICKSSVGGTDDMDVYLPLENPVDIGSGQIFEFEIGNLIVNAD